MNKDDDKLYRNIAEPVYGQPRTCGELIHKYGTYEIQPTSDSDNEFPEIAQGIAPEEKKNQIDKVNLNDRSGNGSKGAENWETDSNNKSQEGD